MERKEFKISDIQLSRGKKGGEFKLYIVKSEAKDLNFYEKTAINVLDDNDGKTYITRVNSGHHSYSGIFNSDDDVLYDLSKVCKALGIKLDISYTHEELQELINNINNTMPNAIYTGMHVIKDSKRGYIGYVETQEGELKLLDYINGQWNVIENGNISIIFGERKNKGDIRIMINGVSYIPTQFKGYFPPSNSRNLKSIEACTLDGIVDIWQEKTREEFDMLL